MLLEDLDDDEADLPPLRRDWERLEDSSVSMETEARHLRTFAKVYTLSQVLGILMLVLCVGWLAGFRGGFAWTSNPALQFNWHPILMLAGMVFLAANGMLMYRGFRTERKHKLKLLHAGVQVGSFVLTIVGLVAVFDSHNLKKDAEGNPAPIPNMYSMHSWMGMAVCILFCLQWVCGLVSFLWPGLRQSLREGYLPAHRWWGVAVFCGACAAALLGLSEKAFFAVKNYSALPAEALLLNALALLVAAYCGVVVFLATQTHYRRRATEEDVLLSAGAYGE